MKRILTLTLAAFIALIAGFVSAADQPLAGNKRVLILCDTVSPPANLNANCAALSPSMAWEVQAAMGLGFMADIACVSEWNSISNATVNNTAPPSPYLRFGQYWAIVLGDPSCIQGTAPVAVAAASRALWSPIIRNGNILINGEDFSYHAPCQLGARIFITNAIRFVTDCPTNTGLYVSLSCYYASAGNIITPVPVLDQVSLAGGFSVVGGNHEKAKLVATHPALTGLNDAVLSNYGNSSHNLFRVWPSDFTVLAMMLDADAVNKIYAAAGNLGAPYIMAKGKGLVPDPPHDCCVTITNKLVECLETNMTYKWDFCITNCWTNSIKYLSILDLPPGVTPSEDIITLQPVLSPGQGTCLTLYLTNAAGLTNLCFTVGAHTTNFFECCSVTNCLTLPPCCVWIFNDVATPITGQANCYTYTQAVIKNLSSTPMKYLFFVPQPDAPNNCFTFTPNFITFTPPLLPGATATTLQKNPTTLKLKINPPCPMPFCFLASVHDSNLVNCCSSREYITHVKKPVDCVYWASTTVVEAGTAFSVSVIVDGSDVGAKSLTLYEGTNAVTTIVNPADGQHDYFVSNAMVGTYVFTWTLTDDLDAVWSTDPATFYVVEHQHPPPAPAPLLQNPELEEGNVRFSMQTERGVTCHVEYTESLTSPNWKVLQSIVGDGSKMTVTDSLTNAPQRFYRVRVP